MRRELPSGAGAKLLSLACTAPLESLRFHGLEPLALMLREPGSSVGGSSAHQHAVIARQVAEQEVLKRVRDAVTGRIMVLKGPELAARYPERVVRQYGDLDLLVEDAEGAQKELIRSGFSPSGDPDLYIDIHHRRPLQYGGLPIPIELHDRPKWISWSASPEPGELFASAQPATLPVPGFFAPRAKEHAVLVAVHAWAHEPLRRLRDLLDVYVLLDDVDRAEVDALATRWGVQRLWRVTVGAVDAVLLDEGHLPRWARHLQRGSERTLAESHLRRWMSDFAGAPLGYALRALPRTLADEILPAPGESWPAKARRVARALGGAAASPRGPAS
jgi:hypothetical protein